MNRSAFVSGLGAAVGAASVGAGLEASASAPEISKRPNLVYVFADQLRYGSCGYAGDEYARTPNMDRLASEGCNLHQAVSCTPVCAPYRASLMTDTFESCSWYEQWTKDRNIVNTAKGVTQNLDALNSLVAKWFPGSVGDKAVEQFPIGT